MGPFLMPWMGSINFGLIEGKGPQLARGGILLLTHGTDQRV
jgi:hypothetical protein